MLNFENALNFALNKTCANFVALNKKLSKIRIKSA